MNAKQLEEMVRNQGAAIEGMNTAHGMLAERLHDTEGQLGAMHEVLTSVQKVTQELHQRIEQLKTWIGADESDGPFYGEFKALSEIVVGLQEKVEARNKSAPAKRNMTDADARNVMNGECKELEHKDAAEKLGLTYAQVYSCRGEYTFKHIHKELKDAGFKNPWAKAK